MTPEELIHLLKLEQWWIDEGLFDHPARAEMQAAPYHVQVVVMNRIHFYLYTRWYSQRPSGGAHQKPAARPAQGLHRVPRNREVPYDMVEASAAWQFKS